MENALQEKKEYQFPLSLCTNIVCPSHVNSDEKKYIKWLKNESKKSKLCKRCSAQKCTNNYSIGEEHMLMFVGGNDWK